ncbi:MAG: V-type ATP synthase subunit D [Methanomicrobiaceae archaeon]|nr:V-type ATP synthase subunit D [Methanomicrobiaceae archaeon]
MTQKIIRGIRPTRMELLKLRRREILAQRGHDLLEEKRDAMIMEFLSMIERYRESRKVLGRLMEEAHARILRARLAEGMAAMESAAQATPPCNEFSASERRVMGVRIPVIEKPASFRTALGRGYSYHQTGAALDETADAFEKVMQQALVVGEQEGAIRRLAREIETTKRRVNALENVVIPRIHRTQKYIESHLEELAREDLFRRKRTKSIIRRAEEGQG